MTTPSRPISFARKIGYSLVLTVALLLALEIVLRIVYFNMNSAPALAILDYADLIACRISEWRAERLVSRAYEELNLPPGIDSYDAPFQPGGGALLRELESRYADAFQELAEAVSHADAPLVVLYVPYEDYDSESARHTADQFRAFMRDLCHANDLPFLDLTDEFLRHPADITTCLPDDPHLSRYGHRLVAESLGTYLRDHYLDVRSTYHSKDKPERFGDENPDEDSMEDGCAISFRIITNSQGLRMDHDIAFPKLRQRILVLGDSVTFGPFVDYVHTYVGQLNRMYPDQEYINAGVSGYTITDELDLFNEQAVHVEPDIVVLQVSVNDVSGLFYVLRSLGNRRNETYEPSAAEREYVRRLHRAER